MVIQSGVLDENLVEMPKNHNISLFFRVIIFEIQNITDLKKVILGQKKLNSSSNGHPKLGIDENLVEMHKNHNIFPIFRVVISILFGWTGY